VGRRPRRGVELYEKGMVGRRREKVWQCDHTEEGLREPRDEPDAAPDWGKNWGVPRGNRVRGRDGRQARLDVCQRSTAGAVGLGRFVISSTGPAVLLKLV
jgi:hypothetical protein